MDACEAAMWEPISTLAQHRCLQLLHDSETVWPTCHPAVCFNFGGVRSSAPREVYCPKPVECHLYPDFDTS